jgi:SAM-dependent methyltransferase
MKELSKSIPRRIREPDFARCYFVGDGVDIGGKPDPLSLYYEFFPLMRSVRIWDLEDGDAQMMATVADDAFDFVHSSHCLEHLHDPREGLANWLRVVKPGGHVIVTVPDEDLYEQGVFPSTFNRDHKSTFTLFKSKSWCSKSINVLEMVSALGPAAQPVKLELLTATYRYDLPRFDQTSTPVGECAIEIIIRKRPQHEIEAGGRHQRSTAQPSSDMRIHFNQYRDDYQAMKSGNATRPPFTNDDPL